MMPETSVRERRATLDDLMRHEGKAELIGGRIVPLMPTGYRPTLVAMAILLSLHEFIARSGKGKAFTDNIGFAVPPLSSGRESFSPDASYYDGPPPADPMDFIPGPPTFAVEVRSKRDYGVRAEAEMAAKRGDYFEAGTSVVWDVDLQAACVRKYAREAPEIPTIFVPGNEADAEPAVLGWRIAVDQIFKV